MLMGDAVIIRMRNARIRMCRRKIGVSRFPQDVLFMHAFSPGLALSQLQAKAPALSAQSSWGEVLGFLTLGLAIVLTALAGLSLLFSASGFFFKRLDGAQKPAAWDSAPAPPSAPGRRSPVTPVSPVIDEDPLLPAVVAAVVAVVLEDRAFRVLRVAQASGSHDPNSWGEEGRRQIFDSRALPQYRIARSLRSRIGRARVPKGRPIPKKQK